MADCWVRSRMRGVACGFAVTAWAVAAGPAAASTLAYSNYTVIGDQTLQVLSPSAESGQAGELQLVTSRGVLDAWCVDVFNMLSPSGTYDVSSFSGALPGVPALTTQQIGQMGALVRNGDALVASPPSGLSADDIGAAIQIAIWEVEYPTFSYSWSPAHPEADTLAAAYLADATSGAWTPYFGVHALVETSNQTGATDQTLMAAIPEASTWVMALIGFAAMGWTLSGRRTRLAHSLKGETT